MTTPSTPAPKAKSSGCGCSSLLLVLGGLTLLNTSYSSTKSFQLSGSEQAALEEQTQAIRLQFENEECARLYQAFNVAADSSSANAEFNQLCVQKGSQYRESQSIEHQGTACIITVEGFGSTEFTQCVQTYEVVLKDGTSLVENYTWVRQDGSYQLIGFDWSDS